jgi:hypothetical protein
MQSSTIHQITNNLRKLPAEKLAVVRDFVAYLTEKEGEKGQKNTVLLSKTEYEQLLRYKRIAVFDDFARQIGQEAEKSVLSEEDLMAELEETKRKVFDERYGRS